MTRNSNAKNTCGYAFAMSPDQSAAFRATIDENGLSVAEGLRLAVEMLCGRYVPAAGRQRAAIVRDSTMPELKVPSLAALARAHAAETARGSDTVQKKRERDAARYIPAADRVERAS